MFSMWKRSFLCVNSFGLRRPARMTAALQQKRVRMSMRAPVAQLEPFSSRRAPPGWRPRGRVRDAHRLH